MSQALTDLQQGLALARELLTVEARLKDPPTSRSRPRVQALRAGALVLTVGAWETFLKEMVTEHFSALTRGSGVRRQDLPTPLQVTALWNSINAGLAGPPFTKTERKDRLPGLLRASVIAIRDDIEPGSLPQTKGNPGADTVREMFGSLGLAKIWQSVEPDFVARWGAPVADLPGLVDGVVRNRHVAAHTPRILSVARSDVNESVRIIQTISEVLDDHVAKYCAATRATALAARAARRA